MLKPTSYHDGHTTEGLKFHSWTEQWHDRGYDGEGVDIAVIDGGFDGFETAELPPVSTSPSLLQSTQFYCYHNDYNPSSTNATLCRGPIKNGILTPENHGTQVAEIVMDMAPGADLYLVRVSAVQQINHALPWLHSKGIDMVVMSATFPFEGPGDGTSGFPTDESLLDIIDRATDTGLVWVNAAGNYADGQSWATTSPETDTHNGTRWIQFYEPSALEIDLFNPPGIGNKLERNSDDIDLRWYHSTDPNTDLNLYVYDGGGVARAVSDRDQQNTMMPSTEHIRFGELPNTGGPYHVRIEVASQTILEYIQLVVDDGLLLHSVKNMSLANPADSTDPNILVVGAVEGTRSSYLVAYYSSRGPTADGRDKPDMWGLSEVTTRVGA